jgi:hypothetical protein
VSRGSRGARIDSTDHPAAGAATTAASDGSTPPGVARARTTMNVTSGAATSRSIAAALAA